MGQGGADQAKGAAPESTCGFVLLNRLAIAGHKLDLNKPLYIFLCTSLHSPLTHSCMLFLVLTKKVSSHNQGPFSTENRKRAMTSSRVMKFQGSSNWWTIDLVISSRRLLNRGRLNAAPHSTTRVGMSPNFSANVEGLGTTIMYLLPST